MIEHEILAMCVMTTESKDSGEVVHYNCLLNLPYFEEEFNEDTTFADITSPFRKLLGSTTKKLPSDRTRGE